VNASSQNSSSPDTFIIVGEYGAHLIRIDGLGEIAEVRMQNGIGNFVTGGSGAYI